MGDTGVGKIAQWIDRVPRRYRWIGYWTAAWIVAVAYFVQWTWREEIDTFSSLETTLAGHSLSLAIQAHGVLAAVWIVYGGRGRPWRVSAAVLLAAVAGYDYVLIDAMTGDITPREFLWISSLGLIVCIGTEIALVLIGWFWGVRIMAINETVTPTPPRSRWQFRLSDAFAWTTATALGLGMFRYLVPHVWFPGLQTILLCLAEALPLCIFSLLLLWLALGNRVIALRVLACCAYVAALEWFFRLSPEARAEFAIETVLLVVPLWIVRMDGYRLVRIAHAPPSSGEAPT